MIALPALSLFLSNFFGTVVCTWVPLLAWFFFLPPTDSSCLLRCADVQKRRGTFAYMQSLTKCAERCNLFLGKPFSFSRLRVVFYPVLPVYYVKGTFYFSNKIAGFFHSSGSLLPRVFIRKDDISLFLTCAKTVRGCRVKGSERFPCSHWCAVPSMVQWPVHLNCHGQWHLSIYTADQF